MAVLLQQSESDQRTIRASAPMPSEVAAIPPQFNHEV